MCMGNIIFSKELVSHREIDFKICTLLYTLYTFFMSKVPVPHLKIAVHFCTLLYTLIFHLPPKCPYPTWISCPKSAYFLFTSVHFGRSKFANLKNLKIPKNPHPGPGIWNPNGAITHERTAEENTTTSNLRVSSLDLGHGFRTVFIHHAEDCILVTGPIVSGSEIMTSRSKPNYLNLPTFTVLYCPVVIRPDLDRKLLSVFVRTTRELDST